MTGAATAAFAYDGLGRRVQRTVAGSTVKYLYDGLDAVLEKSSTGNPIARYLRGLAIDEPWLRSDLTLLAEGGVTNGLRAWWKFNEGTGTSAADSSGNGNTGTLANGAGWGSGVASNAVNLDGANDYLSVGDKATLEGNATWTFAAWINPDTFPAGRDTWLFYKQNVLQWGFTSTALRQLTVNIGGGGNNSLQGAVTNSTQLASNAWTHVTVTYTNSTVRFYVNGILTDTISKTYTMGSNNKAFSVSTASQSFDGRIDDARYYNRALSDTEIAGVYGETASNRVYLADALGSIVALTDTGRVIQTEYDYEPFGKSTVSGLQSASPYSFTAREDDGTGLYYYRARYYHPALARFVSEDPLGMVDGPNVFVFVHNSPLNWIDPSGMIGKNCTFPPLPGPPVRDPLPHPGMFSNRQDCLAACLQWARERSRQVRDWAETERRQYNWPRGWIHNPWNPGYTFGAGGGNPGFPHGTGDGIPCLMETDRRIGEAEAGYLANSDRLKALCDQHCKDRCPQ